VVSETQIQKQFQFLDANKKRNIKVKTLASLRSDRVADFTGIDSVHLSFTALPGIKRATPA